MKTLFSSELMGSAQNFADFCCIGIGFTAGLARVSATLEAAVTGHGVVRLIFAFLALLWLLWLLAVETS